jgi:electron transfer flavoprotein beta subunit
LKVVVLLSVGRHPASGRPRRAPCDARALELALRLPGSSLTGLHAGDPSEPALRDYLGMGLETLLVLALPTGHDPVSALAERLAALGPDLVLAGSSAEAGEASGMVPYMLAHGLGLPLVCSAAFVSAVDKRLEIVQAIGAGGRRALALTCPALVTVGMAAPSPRAVAFGRARRARIEVAPTASTPDAWPASVQSRPWRVRPGFGSGGTSQSARDRLRAATEMGAGHGRTVLNLEPADAAAAILAKMEMVGVGAGARATPRHDGRSARGGNRS